MARGTIRDFIGRQGSGIALLRIETPRGRILEVPCENGPTARALRRLFGSIQEAIDGQIEYGVGDFGLLGWVNRVE